MATQVTLNSGSVDSAGSLALKTNGTTTAVTVGTDQSFNFSATGQRITGDFSNATIASRAMFQSSTTNGQSALGLLPNGTSTQTQYIAFNSTDPANSSYIQTLISATEARINSGQLGTGTNLPMTFFTGGSERVRIDTSGNVGIGTSSPQARFHTAFSTTGEIGRFSTSLNDFVFGTVRSSSVSTFFGGADASVGWAGTLSNHPYVLKVNDTERARIDSSGNLLVGASSEPSASVAGVKICSPTVAYSRFSAGNNNSEYYQIGFLNGNGLIGRISTNGSATSYVTSSDYRLKNSITPMTGALEKVALLKPCTYKWNADDSDGEGFIAHELAEVVPQCVSGEKDAVETYTDEDGNEQTRPSYQGIDTSFLVATLTAAIQELKTLVDTQASTITTLTDRITALEAK